MGDNNNNLYAGMQYGMGDLKASVQIGGQRLMSDIGRYMPAVAPANMNQMINARHGLYSRETSLGHSILAITGFSTPKNTTLYEDQQMAARDMGQRAANVAVMGTFQAGAAAASWFGGAAILEHGIKGAYKFGKSTELAPSLGSVAAKIGLKSAAGEAAVGGLFGAAAVVPGLMAVSAISKYGEEIVGDIKERQQTMNFLEASSFRYASGAGKDFDKNFGGFNRKAREKIVHNMKDIDYNDSSYSMKDLQGVLSGGTELGLFNGTKDADDFSKKFKGLTETLKKVTKTLHVSLQDGLKTIKSLKEQGYTNTDSMGDALMTADVLGSASGRTASEMLSFGRQGSEMVRGTGISMSAGSKMMMSNVSTVGQLAQNGSLSEEQIAQAGGKLGLAQQMMGSSIAVMSSGYGKGILASLGDSSGGLDMTAFKSLMGGTDMSTIAKTGMGKIQTTGQYINSYVNQGKRIKELSNQFGGKGIEMAALAANVANARSITAVNSDISPENALRFSMKSMGMSDSVIETQLARFDNLDTLKKNQSASFRLASKKAASEIFRTHTNIMGKIGDSLQNTFIRPISEPLSNAYNSVSGFVSDVTTDIGNSIKEKITGNKIFTVAGNGKSVTEMLVAEKTNAAQLGKDGGFQSKAQNLIYTKDEVSDFLGSSAYKKIARATGMSANTESFKTDSANEFANNVFGKDFKDLSKDEVLYSKSIASITNSDLSEDMDDIKDESISTLGKDKQKYMIKKAKKYADAKAKSEANIRKMGVHMGVESDQEALVKVYRSKEGGKLFDKLRVAQAALENAKGSSFITDDVEGNDEKIKDLTATVATASANIAGLLKQESPDTAEEFLRNAGSIRSSDLEDIAKSDKVMQKNQMGKALAFAQLTSKQELRALSSRGAAQLENKGDRRTFRNLVGRLSDGSDMSSGDYKKLRELSGEAKQGSLKTLASLGEMALDAEGEAKDHNISVRKATDLLVGAGVKITDEQTKTLFMGDGKITAKEVIQHATLAATSLKSGSAVVGDSSEVSKAEANALDTLVRVQREQQDLLHTLTALSIRLKGNM